MMRLITNKNNMLEWEKVEDCYQDDRDEPDSSDLARLVLPRQQGRRELTKWDARFIGLARHIAEWSKDPSTKVGCILVDSSRVVVGMGYNGFPRGVDDSDSRYQNRELKYQLVQHAEINAILNSTKSVKGCVAYVTHPPCCNCSGSIIQSGISEVVAVAPERGLAERYKSSFENSKMMFNEAGINYIEISRGECNGNI